MLGEKGEEKVSSYLRKNGYIIVKRNYRDRFGEIDIVAERGNLLAFVEVKTRFEGALVSGLEAIDKHKRRRIRLTASEFLKKIPGDYDSRFDVESVEVYMKPDETLGWRLEYIEDAF